MQEDFDNPAAELKWSFATAIAFALGALALATVAGVYLSDSEGAAVTAGLVEEAKRRTCPATIAQFGPGERWAGHHHVYACVTAAKEVPAHILSYPLAESQ